MLKLVLVILVLVQYFEPGEKLISTTTLLLSTLFYLYNRPRKITLKNNNKDFKVAIIGAGFSGLGMAIKLKQNGIPFVIIEKAKEVGGTWWYNRYPGCACDIPSHLYSFSYEPNMNWTEVFPKQSEIEEYLIGCAKKYNLYPSIQFETKFHSAKFNNETSKWELKVERKDGKEEEIITVNAIVSGVGGLHIPNFPNIKGRELFKGLSFHTSEWNNEFEKYKDKKIAIIGSAASAIQIVPELQKTAEKLYVLQRTPNWISPRPNGPYSSNFRSLLQKFPIFQTILRYYYYLRQEFILLIVFKAGGWGSKFNERMLKFFIKKKVKDAKTYDGSSIAQSLTPNYPPGCKRILLSNDYYSAVASPNVSLVTNPIKEIRENGVVIHHNGQDELLEVDVIVYATGFAVMNQFPDVYGKSGKNLALDVWRDKPQAYLGVLTPDYPNFFTLLGPNTGLGHNSVVWMIECQVNFVEDCLRHLINGNHREINIKKKYFDDLQITLQKYLKDSIWSRKYCVSWYQNSDGFIYTLWYGSTLSYWYNTLFTSTFLFDFK